VTGLLVGGMPGRDPGEAATMIGDFGRAQHLGDGQPLSLPRLLGPEQVGNPGQAPRLWRERFDLMQCHSLVNVDVVVPMLRAWKKEGRTRFVGVTHHENDYHDVLAGWIERGGVDFVQVNYSVANRGAEERVFRAAADRGVAVLINMALEKGRLHKIVTDRPLPDFAREIGAENWAQFFLKFAMSHPAVTTVLCATGNPAHAAGNVGALRGTLPDASLRARMVRHMESIPGFDGLARMPWYPDKQAMYQGLIRRSQAAMRARLT